MLCLGMCAIIIAARRVCGCVCVLCVDQFESQTPTPPPSAQINQLSDTQTVTPHESACAFYCMV